MKLSVFSEIQGAAMDGPRRSDSSRILSTWFRFRWHGESCLPDVAIGLIYLTGCRWGSESSRLHRQGREVSSGQQLLVGGARDPLKHSPYEVLIAWHAGICQVGLRPGSL